MEREIDFWRNDMFIWMLSYIYRQTSGYKGILRKKADRLSKANYTYNESELISEIGSGSVAAFDQLYRQFYPALSLLSFRLSRSRELAKDVVSDVFLHLWESRDELGKVANLKAYLYISTRNRTLNYLKSKAVSASEELTEKALASQEPSAETFFEALLHTETVRALREAVDVLPAECKRVTELVLKGHSTGEIAEMLGISPSAVSHQKARAIRILKDNVILTVLLACLSGG